MSKALSVDLRERVVAAVDGGLSCRSAAARFGVGVSSAIRWVQRARTRGDLTPDRRGGAVRPARIDAHGERILAWIAEAPDLTLSEIAARLAQEAGYRPPVSVVHVFFRRHGITRKKRQRTPPNSSGRT